MYKDSLLYVDDFFFLIKCNKLDRDCPGFKILVHFFIEFESPALKQ